MLELDYFGIDGAVGGNQDWFSNVVMHIGGCAAAAACDTCIYFGKRFGVQPDDEAVYPAAGWRREESGVVCGWFFTVS